MEDGLRKTAQPDTAFADGTVSELQSRQYELLFKMTTQLLATPELDERLLLALDTITVELGFPHASIALLDKRKALLRMRMAAGFPNNKEVERIEIPLDSSAAGVSVVHTGRPAWITRQGGEWAPYIGDLAYDSDILALPLFGGELLSERADADFARRLPSENKYWLPERMCIGALYVGANRERVDNATMQLLGLCADSFGVTIAAAIHTERIGSVVRKLQRERQWVESIMKSVADPIVLTNLDNEILLQNQRAEELFSGSSSANEGKRRALKMNDLLFSAYLSSATVSSTEIIGQDLTLVDPLEGSDIHFEVISTPALNSEGERIGLVSIFRDVTDLREATKSWRATL